MKRNVNGGVTGLIFGLFIAAIYALLQVFNGSFEVKTTLLTALVTGAAAGLLFGLYIRSFAKRQAEQFRPIRERLENEGEVFLDDAANHYYSGEYVGGRMYLTDKGLYYIANPMNVMSHSVKFSYGEIERAEVLKDAGFSNGVVVHTADGKKEYFTVPHHKEWLAKIEEKIKEV